MFNCHLKDLTRCIFSRKYLWKAIALYGDSRGCSIYQWLNKKKQVQVRQTSLYVFANWVAPSPIDRVTAFSSMSFTSAESFAVHLLQHDGHNDKQPIFCPPTILQVFSSNWLQCQLFICPICFPVSNFRCKCCQYTKSTTSAFCFGDTRQQTTDLSTLPPAVIKIIGSL